MVQTYVNCDIDRRFADLVFDLQQPPYPILDDSVIEILAYQVLEHMVDLPTMLDELHRILKPGGRLKIQVPHFSSYGAMGQYDHKTTFHFNSLGWCDMAGTKSGMLHNARLWHIRQRHLVFALCPTWMSHLAQRVFNAHKALYKSSGLGYLFPAVLIEFALEKPTRPRRDK